MRVTQVEELSKSRSKVDKGELRLYHIKEGEEITPENYHTIMTEVLPKRAKLRAMNLLKSREYTTAQLRAKLQQGYYPPNVIEAALEYVASFHYTDDLRYAMDFITYNECRKSRLRIEQDLLNKGIDRETVEQAWTMWEAEGGEQDEQAMITALLEKKNYNASGSDYKEKQKIYAFLMRKGFQSEQVRKAMESYDVPS